MDTVEWRLKDYLAAHDLTAYQLVKASSLAPNTVYSLARGKQTQVRLDTIAGVLGGLRQLTGNEVALTDILVHETKPEPEPEDDAILKEDEDLLLASGTADLQEALDEIEADLPAGEVDRWLETFYQAADTKG